MASEPWYPVAKNDIFPEEFASFLLGDPMVRKLFLQHHRDLLSPKYWRTQQDNIRAGKMDNFYPYPQELRLSKRYPDRKAPRT
jgi:isocitrate dehydrogenase kinase/phosphatase